jgi:hypothetical protein
MIAFDRPRHFNSSVSDCFDQKPKGICFVLGGPMANTARIAPVAAIAQYVGRYGRAWFRRALACVNIFKAPEWRRGQKERASHDSTL